MLLLSRLASYGNVVRRLLPWMAVFLLLLPSSAVPANAHEYAGHVTVEWSHGRAPASDASTTIQANNSADQVVAGAGAGFAFNPSPSLDATNTTGRLPTAQTWGRLDTLDDHFVRHGADFGASTADEYAALASDFFESGIARGLPTRIDPKTGVIRIYDSATNTFGAFNPSGTTATFFKPNPAIHGYPTNWDYWLAQPGGSPWP